jgi:hypothetical protein
VKEGSDSRLRIQSGLTLFPFMKVTDTLGKETKKILVQRNKPSNLLFSNTSSSGSLVHFNDSCFVCLLGSLPVEVDLSGTITSKHL